MARLQATELFPTPPLPLITSTTFFTSGSGSSGPTAREVSSRGGLRAGLVVGGHRHPSLTTRSFRSVISSMAKRTPSRPSPESRVPP